MPVYQVDISKLSASLKAEMKGKTEAVIAAIQQTVGLHGHRLVLEEIDRAKPRPPVDRGAYKRSWYVSKLQNGAMLYNPLTYAGVIELGRRPGTMPPVDALERWVKRKGLVKRAKAEFKVRKAAAGAGVRKALRKIGRPPTAREIAWAIAISMKKHGWPRPPNQPMRVLERAVARLDGLLRLAVAEALRKA